MAGLLAGLNGLRVWPSHGNFILVQVLTGHTADLNEHLVRRGITVRTYSHPRLRDSLRISVGTPAQTDALVGAIDEWLEAQSGRS